VLLILISALQLQTFIYFKLMFAVVAQKLKFVIAVISADFPNTKRDYH